MSIVAISESLGSRGDQIGRALAKALSWNFADREIILQAANRFGEGVTILEHATEERPTLWERVSDAQHHYAALVESTLLDMAVGDNVVLVGRGAPFVLRGVRHVLRVRISAPEKVRARDIEARQGLTADAAAHLAHHSDRERAARIRFLYHVDWDDPLLYDLVLNTERLEVEEAVRIIRESVTAARLQPSEDSRQALRDLALTSRALATLLVNPSTRRLRVTVTCQDAHLTVTGIVAGDAERKQIEETLAQLPGVAGVVNQLVAAGGMRHPLSV